MKNDSLKGRAVAIISTAMILVVCAITAAMYFVTGYYLYFFLAMTSLFLGANSLFFILLKYIDTLSKLPDPDPSEIEKKKKRKKKVKRSKRKAAAEEVVAEEEIVEEVPTEEQEPKKKKWKFTIDYFKIAKVLTVLVYLVVYYYTNKTVLTFAQTMPEQKVPAIVNAVFFLLLFVIMIVLDRLCKHSENETSFVDAIIQNSRIFYKLLIVESLLAAICAVYETLNLYNVQKYVGYAYTGAFYYFVVFITISILVIAIRKEFCVAPYINVPIPMWKRKKDAQRIGFIEYLETNTGISMRSLVSVKYIKQIAPIVVFVSGVALWLSTCIVQVEPYQQAAVYRIGSLQDKALQPGIHLVLPYPFDKVEIYNTDTVQKTTIGYKATESGDNIWTEGHDGEEYKLLLGGGDELVSINLRLEYKIDDLMKYLTTTSNPESHMQALAYELVTDQTISTDLDSLLSADRDKFANNFKKELVKKMDERDIGLEVVSVVLESIHPPVDIASVYQELISAGITAEKYIAYAKGNAAVSIANAEAAHDTLVGTAKADYSSKVATAKASVAEFTASVEAYKSNKDAYTYYKYLNAVREAYGNANLVILGDGVDESRLYFGSFVTGSSGSTQTE